MFPTLAKDFLNGFKLGVQENIAEVELFIESIGKASNEDVLKVAEKLLLQEDIDLTISFCSIFHLDAMVEKFDKYKIPLLFVDLGGSIPKKVHFSPYVLHHSLHLCDSAYLAGTIAAEKFGKKGALLSSFYDGGYQLSSSFVTGYLDAGGTIVYNNVSPMDYRSSNYEKMLKELKENRAEVAFSLFSFNEAKHFFEFLSEQDAEGLPFIMASPVMTDESMQYPDFGNLPKTLSVASWSFEYGSANMVTFMETFKATYGNVPNVISLLGHESGLIANALINNGEITFEKIKNTTIEGSPRGQILISKNNQTKPKKQLLRKFEFNGSAYINSVIEELSKGEPIDLVETFEEIQYSGWKNPYICT